MSIHVPVQTPDGEQVLQFPTGTSPAVIDKVLQEEYGQRYTDLWYHYNTAIPKKFREDYYRWVEAEDALREKQGRESIVKDMADYDLQGYWLWRYHGDGKDKEGDASGHGPDLFKKPNHPTFSKESIYSGSKEEGKSGFTGGDWGTYTYLAGDTGASDEEKYFRRGPDSMYTQEQVQKELDRGNPDAGVGLGGQYSPDRTWSYPTRAEEVENAAGTVGTVVGAAAPGLAAVPGAAAGNIIGRGVGRMVMGGSFWPKPGEITQQTLEGGIAGAFKPAAGVVNSLVGKAAQTPLGKQIVGSVVGKTAGPKQPLGRQLSAPEPPGYPSYGEWMETQGMYPEGFPEFVRTGDYPRMPGGVPSRNALNEAPPAPESGRTVLRPTEAPDRFAPTEYPPGYTPSPTAEYFKDYPDWGPVPEYGRASGKKGFVDMGTAGGINEPGPERLALPPPEMRALPPPSRPALSPPEPRGLPGPSKGYPQLPPPEARTTSRPGGEYSGKYQAETPRSPYTPPAVTMSPLSQEYRDITNYLKENQSPSVNALAKPPYEAPEVTGIRGNWKEPIPRRESYDMYPPPKRSPGSPGLELDWEKIEKYAKPEHGPGSGNKLGRPKGSGKGQDETPHGSEAFVFGVDELPEAAQADVKKLYAKTWSNYGNAANAVEIFLNKHWMDAKNNPLRVVHWTLPDGKAVYGVEIREPGSTAWLRLDPVDVALAHGKAEELVPKAERPYIPPKGKGTK